MLAPIGAVVGPEMPIVRSLDPRANITGRMLALTTAMAADPGNSAVDEAARRHGDAA